MRTAVRCGFLFRFEALPVGDEGEQIVVLERRLIVDQGEAASVDDIEVIAGGLGDSSIQLGLGYRRVLGEWSRGETKSAAPERLRSGWMVDGQR